jgi:hypothetical protein
MWAYRRTWYNPAMRADNSVPNGGQVNMPDAVGSANATDGIANHAEQVTTDYATPGDPTTTVNGQIKTTAKKVADILAATTPGLVDPAIPANIVQPAEIACCDASGQVVYAVILQGGLYTKP